MTLLIIDGNNLAHRMNYVMNLTHPNTGEEVGVVYGVLKVIGSLISKFEPRAIAVCWDGGVPDFRRQAVPEYKAHRSHSDDPIAWQEFVRQMNELDEILPEMGIVSIRKPGVEADDHMFQLSRMYMLDSIIVTNDMDLLQAVDDKVLVWNPSQEEIFDITKVEELTGVDFDKFLDWRAIQGDSSDGIPGIRGVGPKTATKLFEQFGTLTGIINAAKGHHPAGEEPTPKLKENILAFGEDKIFKNIYASVLAYDRVGSRQAILEATATWKPADKKFVKSYLIKQAFISLMNEGLHTKISKLKKPMLNVTDMRIPVNFTGRRKPGGKVFQE